MTKFRTLIQGVALAALLLAPGAAVAQEDASANLQQLIKDLNALIDKGEQERLGDPWFLKDLRDLTRQYENPWPSFVYGEEFQTDGAAPSPWRVVQGEMRVDWRFGLRSLVRAAPAAAAEPQQKTDPGRQLLGAILQGVLTSKSGGQQTTTQAVDDTQPAVALAETPLSNALKISAEVTARALSDGTTAAFQIGVYQQAQSAHPGYRVSYRASDGTLSLLRISSRGGVAVVETVTAPAGLDDGNTHSVVLSRGTDAVLQVAIDGATLIEVADRGFSDPWSGLILSNLGGDFALRRISVSGRDGA